MTNRIDLNASAGAVAQPAYMHRTSRVYAIYETEMDTISTLNVVSTTAFSLAGSFFSFAIGLHVTNAINPAITPDGKAIVMLGQPAGLILSVACLVIGFIAWNRKGGTLKTIKSESREISPDQLS